MWMVKREVVSDVAQGIPHIIPKDSPKLVICDLWVHELSHGLDSTLEEIAVRMRKLERWRGFFFSEYAYRGYLGRAGSSSRFENLKKRMPRCREIRQAAQRSKVCTEDLRW